MLPALGNRQSSVDLASKKKEELSLLLSLPPLSTNSVTQFAEFDEPGARCKAIRDSISGERHPETIFNPLPGQHHFRSSQRGIEEVECSPADVVHGDVGERRRTC